MLGTDRSLRICQASKPRSSEYGSSGGRILTNFARLKIRMIEKIEEGREHTPGGSFASAVIFQESVNNPFYRTASVEENRAAENHTADCRWENDDDIRYLVDHSTEAFWQMDKDLKFTFTNAACEKISGGFKKEDFIGRSLLEFLTPEGIEHLWKINGLRLTNEARGIKTDLVFYELQMRRKDGTYFWAGISSCPVRNQNGELIGYQGIMRDIDHFKKYETDRKRLEDLLAKTERMAALGKLAGSAAHELNNIMAGIIGYAELLLFKENTDESTFRKNVGNIINSGERAAALVQDLLVISRRDRGVRKPINLNELIPICLEKCELKKMSEQDSGITLSMDLEPSLHPVFGCFPQLDKSIRNLLNLSCEQAGPDGAVGIATRTVYLGRPVSGYDHLHEGEYVVLSITDDGDGIADEDLHHIFEPFYIRKVMKKNVTGLELSVAREVIKDHNGFIDVTSKAGCGATITIYLPVLPDETPVRSQEIHADGPTSIN